ncbi:hypothetical protein AALP_AA5G277000 [Arabis alpina]|uniref:RRM domain-containing protein n=1 Tax=Arabis alpina TaxID=50452 RepID=A0A087GZS2_ARAAL|nr:hypothetical protein AALP_AA5G277000 [Arabis alpina]
MEYYNSSKNSDINGPTYSEAFAKRLYGRKTLYEERLSRCFKVSVEGHDCTSLYAETIRCGFIYFEEEVAQEKALTLSSVFLTGYDTSCPADVLKAELFSLFSSCGEILYLTVDTDPSQPGLLNKFAFVCLVGKEARDNALRLDGSDLGGRKLVVEALEPKGDHFISADDAKKEIGPGYALMVNHPSTSITTWQ